MAFDFYTLVATKPTRDKTDYEIQEQIPVCHDLHPFVSPRPALPGVRKNHRAGATQT